MPTEYPGTNGDSRLGAGGMQATGAPGSTGADFLNPTHAPTTDLVTPTTHTDAENVSGTVFGAGSHNGVEASENHHPIVGESPDSTGAGNGSITNGSERI